MDQQLLQKFFRYVVGQNSIQFFVWILDFPAWISSCCTSPLGIWGKIPSRFRWIFDLYSMSVFAGPTPVIKLAVDPKHVSLGGSVCLSAPARMGQTAPGPLHIVAMRIYFLPHAHAHPHTHTHTCTQTTPLLFIHTPHATLLRPKKKNLQAQRHGLDPAC